MRKKNDHWAQQEANLPQVCFISHKIPLKAKKTASNLFIRPAKIVQIIKIQEMKKHS